MCMFRSAHEEFQSVSMQKKKLNSAACSSWAPVKKSVFRCRKPKKASRMLSMDPDCKTAASGSRTRVQTIHHSEPFYCKPFSSSSVQILQCLSFAALELVPDLSDSMRAIAFIQSRSITYVGILWYSHVGLLVPIQPNVCIKQIGRAHV